MVRDVSARDAGVMQGLDELATEAWNADGADLELPIWAGLLPLETGTGAPESSPDLLHGIEVPPYVARPNRPSTP